VFECEKYYLQFISWFVMEAVRYSEWVPAGALVKGLMVMFSAIIVFGTSALFLWGNMSVEDIFGLVLGWGILAFILFLFWNYRGLTWLGDFSVYLVSVLELQRAQNSNQQQ
jgi:hypothetical protein